MIVAAAAAAAAAVVLPHARRRSRFGVAAVGATLVGVSMAAGVGVGGVLMIAVVWATAAAVAARIRR